MNYRFDAVLIHDMLNKHSVVLEAKTAVYKLQQLHKDLTDDILWMRKRMKIFADKKRIKRLILKERDKTYLLRQNIKTI